MSQDAVQSRGFCLGLEAQSTCPSPPWTFSPSQSALLPPLCPQCCAQASPSDPLGSLPPSPEHFLMPPHPQHPPQHLISVAFKALPTGLYLSPSPTLQLSLMPVGSCSLSHTCLGLAPLLKLAPLPGMPSASSTCPKHTSVQSLSCLKPSLKTRSEVAHLL